MVIPIVYMAAGLSKRFGGNPKQLIKVGPKGETLIECAADQALAAGFDKIVFITGEKTHDSIKSIFSNSYMGVKVSYATQRFDPVYRDNPWGSVDALCSAAHELREPFVVVNSDDLYGIESMKIAKDALLKDSLTNVAIGYKIIDVIPPIGTVNRGVFKVERGIVKSIKEEEKITHQNYAQRGLTASTLCSMNLFGLSVNTLQKLKERLSTFKETNRGNRTIECLLPAELSKIIEEGARIKVYPAKNKWVGITNPGDEEAVRDYLKKQPN